MVFFNKASANKPAIRRQLCTPTYR